MINKGKVRIGVFDHKLVIYDFGTKEMYLVPKRKWTISYKAGLIIGGLISYCRLKSERSFSSIVAPVFFLSTEGKILALLATTLLGLLLVLYYEFDYSGQYKHKEIAKENEVRQSIANNPVKFDLETNRFPLSLERTVKIINIVILISMVFTINSLYDFLNYSKATISLYRVWVYSSVPLFWEISYIYFKYLSTKRFKKAVSTYFSSHSKA